MMHPESTRLSRRRLLAMAGVSAGGALLAQTPLFADGGGAGPAAVSAITANLKNTSFGPLKQIDAGLLNVGYADAGPANGPSVILLQGWPYDIYSYVDCAVSSFFKIYNGYWLLGRPQGRSTLAVVVSRRANRPERPRYRGIQGEDWFFDYEKQGMIKGVELIPPHSHPEDQPSPGPAGRVPANWESLLH